MAALLSVGLTVTLAGCLPEQKGAVALWKDEVGNLSFVVVACKPGLTQLDLRTDSEELAGGWRFNSDPWLAKDHVMTVPVSSNPPAGVEVTKAVQALPTGPMYVQAVASREGFVTSYLEFEFKDVSALGKGKYLFEFADTHSVGSRQEFFGRACS